MPKPLNFPGGTLIPTGGWVDPRAGLDGDGEEKISCFCHDSNPTSSSPKMTELSQLLIHKR